MPDAQQLSVGSEDGARLDGEQSGEGAAVVLLHGLTATRRYVVMGSRSLERSGHRVIAFDARGHGRSAPAPRREAYDYTSLARDLHAILEQTGVERAVLAGASMGAHTALRFALDHPERVAALALITPAYDPHSHGFDGQFAGWDALARGLREGGVEGFIAAYDLSTVPEAMRATIETVLRQRLGAHEHPLAVADALEAVPRSRPFASFAELRAIAVPTVVIASRDEADPGHPLRVGETYAREIAGAELVIEEPSADGAPIRSPIAWQGGQLSKLIAALTARV